MNPFTQALSVCAAHGEGSVRYSWPKPGQTDPSPKVTYVKQYAPWGWIVGSGLYVDDIDAALARARRAALLITPAVLSAAILLSYWLAGSLSRPVMRATHRLTQYSEQAAVAVSHHIQ